MFLNILKAWTLCTQVWHINSRVYTFCMWVARRKVAYSTQLAQRTVAYTARGRKRVYRVKKSIFYMNLMVSNCLFIRLKDGAWVEGEGTWRHGPRSSMRCPHSKCFTVEWVIEILLYHTYAVKRPPIRVFDKLLGSWSWYVWPTRWVFRDYLGIHLLYLRFVTMRSSS